MAQKPHQERQATRIGGAIHCDSGISFAWEFVLIESDLMISD
jgi:hypothetical protein